MQTIRWLRSSRTAQGGFTLLEALTVIATIGILAAVISPVWFGFTEKWRLNAGQDRVYQGIQIAQSKAQQSRTAWEFSIRQGTDGVEWSAHPAKAAISQVAWEPLNPNIQLDGETNFATKAGRFYVRFDEKGNVEYRLGRVTLTSRRSPNVKRCVIMSTLIGASRKAKEQPRPSDGKLCY